MTVTTAVVVLPRRMAIWAARRALARNSLTGIELGCSLCAAVWFSAGKPAAALAGGAALGGGYLARRVGRQLTVGTYAGWLAVICGWAGELAVYAGLAVGAAGSPAVAWKLATGIAMLFALRKVTRLCRLAHADVQPRPVQPAQDRAPADDPPRLRLGVLIGQVLAVPAWARALVITGTASYYGNRTALLVMLYCAAVALAWSLVAGPHRPRAVDRVTDLAAQPGGVAACRDDGPIARFAGALVHGQLVPLPPAVAGLIATVLLAALGLGYLDGLVLLTPVAAMLLAAPGSAHPHDGPAGLAGPGHHPGRPVHLPGRARLRHRGARPGHVRADRPGRAAPAGRGLPGPASADAAWRTGQPGLGGPDAGRRVQRDDWPGHGGVPGPGGLSGLAALR